MQVLPFIRRIKSTAVANVALGAMLAAPMVRIVGIDNIQIHLYGAAGSGKSALNKLLYALMGNPNNVTAIPPANSTVTALEFHFASHRDLPIMIEDINTVTDEQSKEIIQQLIMCFGNNAGRMRGNTDFTLARLNELYGSLITNAEKLMTQYNSNGGSKRRVIELLVPHDLVSESFVEEFNPILKNNYGGFIEEWIDFIQENQESIKQLYKSVLEKFRNLTTDKVPRHLQSLALITTANIFFDKLFLYPNQSMESSTGTEMNIIYPILHNIPCKNEISDVERVKTLVKEWIQQNHLMFVEPKQYEQSECFGIETKRYIAIDPQVFKRLLGEHGFSTETIIQQLQLDGFLVKNSGNNVFPLIKITGNKSIRMVKIMKEQLE